MKQAVILAGGMGRRLGALTANTPKPLLRVGDRPFLDYLIEHLRRHGAEHIVLLVGPHEAQYQRYFDERPTFGLQINLVADLPTAGTGGALRHARNVLKERFLLLNGDSYFDFNLLQLLEGDTGIARIALRHVPNTSRYGQVLLDGDRIIGFGEKSSTGEGLINGGVYWLDREILHELGENSVSIENDIFPRLAINGRLTGAIYNGPFIDIGVPDALARAQNLMPKWRRRPAAFLDRDGIINHDTGYVWQRENYKWMEGADRAIKRLNDLGYYVFVVTNQAGVARGLYSAADVEHLHAYINQTLRRGSAHVDQFYYCPHHPDFGDEQYRQDCNCRKPHPGMLLRAMEEWPIDLSRSFMIGDKDSDMEAAEAADIPVKRLFLGGDIEAAISEIAPPFKR